MGWLKNFWEKDWDMHIGNKEGTWIPDVWFTPSRPHEENLSEMRQEFDNVRVMRPIPLWFGRITRGSNPKPAAEDPAPAVEATPS